MVRTYFHTCRGRDIYIRDYKVIGSFWGYAGAAWKAIGHSKCLPSISQQSIFIMPELYLSHSHEMASVVLAHSPMAASRSIGCVAAMVNSAPFYQYYIPEDPFLYGIPWHNHAYP